MVFASHFAQFPGFSPGFCPSFPRPPPGEEVSVDLAAPREGIGEEGMDVGPLDEAWRAQGRVAWLALKKDVDML
jgi:hypothetical protein